MLALVDGDIIVWRCCSVNKNAALGIAKWQADQLINRILEDVNATDWKVYLSGDNNFRKQLYPEYKANRKDMEKPPHFEEVREHLILEWDASICDGIEADDALGIRQCTSSEPSIICSIDKDLRQIPGKHYHFVNRQWSDISELEGWRNFYYQVLVGDPTDNVKGARGWGPVKSTQLLTGIMDADQMYREVRRVYEDIYAIDAFKQLELNAKLLYILRTEGDEWKPPVQEVAAQQLSSTKETDTSSEHMKAAETIIQCDGSTTDTTNTQ